ncbi:MAG: pilus assembly protein PilM [Clostridiales bacterium]|nr:pilus assembly protein PilM [Clostridiales bacterium]
MAARVLNIQIGKRICKVCVSSKKGKAYEITDSFIFATPADTVNDGQIIDAVTLGEELKNELNNHNVYVKNAIFAVSSAKIATREVTIPVVRDDQVKNIVQTNASEYFPVDISNYTIDSIVLEKDEKEMRILVVAVPKVIVEGYISLAEQIGLIINALDFSANCQYRVLHAVAGEGVTMYATVDTDSSSVLFMEGSTLLMHRSIITGGDAIVSDYMDLEKMESWQYGEALKRLNGSEDQPAVVYEGEQSNIDLLTAAISRTRDFFLGGKFADKPIARVVLMGTCSHIAGLKESLASAIGVESFWLDELEGVQGLANSIKDISIYIDCLGSNLAPMKFLPKEYLDKNGKRGQTSSAIKEKYGTVLAIAGAVLALLLVGTQFITYKLQQNELNKINHSISQKEKYRSLYEEYNSYTAGDAGITGFVSGSLKNNSKLVDFLEEMEEKLPKNINTLSASCSETGISFNITAPDYDTAVAAVRAFRSFECLDQVTCSSYSLSESDGIPEVSFAVNCTYKVEIVEQPAAAPEAQAETNADDV